MAKLLLGQFVMSSCSLSSSVFDLKSPPKKGANITPAVPAQLPFSHLLLKMTREVLSHLLKMLLANSDGTSSAAGRE